MDLWKEPYLELVNRTKRRASIWVFCWASVICFTVGHASADIIDDVTQLEKPKKKKKPEKEDEEDKAASPEQATVPLSNPAPVPAVTPTPPQQVPTPPSPVAPSKSTDSAKTEAPSTGALGTSGGKSKSGVSNKDKESRRDLPVYWKGDLATYSQNGTQILIDKNVVITQEDVRLQSDQAKVKVLKGGVGEGVDSAEMIGRVKVARSSKDPTQKMTAQGDRAFFDNSGQIVTIDGNAKLWRDGHLIEGDRIVYEIISGTVKVDKVKGVVQPEKAHQ